MTGFFIVVEPWKRRAVCRAAYREGIRTILLQDAIFPVEIGTAVLPAGRHDAA